MPYLTVNEFKDLLRGATPLRQIAEEYILTGTPYAFRNQPYSMPTITRHLTARIPVQPENILVVGSAKLGFSLNPDGYFNPFTDLSDIDVIVIDEGLFDQIWMTCLDWHYLSRYREMNKSNSIWAGERKKDVYWGFMRPHDIHYTGLYFYEVLKPLRDISTSWFNAFKSFSLYPNFATRRINSRLYRTREHALRYHVEGLRELRDFLS